MFKKIINGRTSRVQFNLLLWISMLSVQYIQYTFFDEVQLLHFFVWLAFALLLVERRLHDFGITMKDPSSVKVQKRMLFFGVGDPYENKYGKPPRF